MTSNRCSRSALVLFGLYRFLRRLIQSKRGIFACCVVSMAAGMAQVTTAVHEFPRQRFVSVASDVKLEVLDWGGTGQAIVLLAGGGNTAHVYATFAPKLARRFHVYGITRRGAGQSSAPASGYTAQQFGDDIVAVLDDLHLKSPILAGHSIAGEEMSSISEHHPGRVRALIYLDAGGPFALYDPEHGDIDTDQVELQADLTALGKDPYKDALITKTLTDDARYRNNLSDLRDEVEGATAPAPTRADRASIAAFQQYFVGYYGGILPEEEIRQLYTITQDGAVGDSISHGAAHAAEEFEYERFLSVDTRALVVIPFPNALNRGVTHVATRLAAYKEQEAHRKQSQLAVWRRQPHAQVVVIPDKTHYVFLSDEAEVLSLIYRFVDSLAKQDGPG